jgi:hypothetical protein
MTLPVAGKGSRSYMLPYHIFGPEGPLLFRCMV